MRELVLLLAAVDDGALDVLLLDPLDPRKHVVLGGVVEEADVVARACDVNAGVQQIRHHGWTGLGRPSVGEKNLERREMK